MTASNEISLEEYQRGVWAATSEAAFQAQVVRLARDIGWGPIYHTRYSAGSQAGYPDLHLLRPGRSLFLELKTMKGVVTPSQKEWHAALRMSGCEAYIFRPCDAEAIAGLLALPERPASWYPESWAKGPGDA